MEELGSDGTGCFGIKVRRDATKFTDENNRILK